MGPTALLPPEGRRAEDFFALKIRRLRQARYLQTTEAALSTSISGVNFPENTKPYVVAIQLKVSCRCSDQVLDNPGFDRGQGTVFLFSEGFRPAVRTNQLPIQWILIRLSPRKTTGA